MSYDLSFLPDGAAPSREAFLAHFKARPNYEIEGDQAWYRSEDTGTYFVFELASADGESDPEDPAAAAWAAFNINYARPRFFAREAVIEIEAFLGVFPGAIVDPQAEEPERGAFDSARFLAAWDRTNATSYEMFVKQAGAGPAAPGEVFDRMWAWNFRREDRSKGGAVFVPKLQFLEHEGRLATIVIWGDAYPSALPRADLVVLVRSEVLAPHGETRPDGTRETFVLPFSRVEPLLRSWQHGTSPAEHWEKAYTEVPADLEEFFRSLRDPVPDGSLQVVPPDRVRDLGATGTPPPAKRRWFGLFGS